MVVIVVTDFVVDVCCFVVMLTGKRHPPRTYRQRLSRMHPKQALDLKRWTDNQQLEVIVCWLGACLFADHLFVCWLLLVVCWLLCCCWLLVCCWLLLVCCWYCLFAISLAVVGCFLFAGCLFLCFLVCCLLMAVCVLSLCCLV